MFDYQMIAHRDDNAQTSAANSIAEATFLLMTHLVVYQVGAKDSSNRMFVEQNGNRNYAMSED